MNQAPEVVADFATIEELAAEICRRSGGDWERKGTKRNLWRKRAMAIVCLANGDEVGARKVMRGPE